MSWHLGVSSKKSESLDVKLAIHIRKSKLSLWTSVERAYNLISMGSFDSLTTADVGVRTSARVCMFSLGLCGFPPGMAVPCDTLGTYR